MTIKKLGTVAVVALPLVVGGLAYASTLANPQSEQPQQTAADSYTCPLTGEELPCPNCCPMNEQK